GIYSLGTYLGCALLDLAFQRARGKDKADLVEALRNAVLVDSPIGPLRLDEFGNAVSTAYIRRIELKNGKLGDTILETYPDVSQFWTYDPTWFLEQPVYSRDYPPAKNLE